MTHTINRPVAVTSLYFKGSPNNLVAFPKRIELDGNSHTFQDGLQCLITQGQRVMRVFTMTDGLSRYQLRHERDNWTLLRITQAS